MDPITILIAGGLLGWGLSRSNGRCIQCGRPRRSVWGIEYEEEGGELPSGIYGDYCPICLILTSPLTVADWSGDLEPFGEFENWDPKRPLEAWPDRMLWDTAETYGFRIPEEMEMLTHAQLGESIQRCRSCGSLFIADYFGHCFNNNQNRYGSYFCPDCLVQRQPFVVNRRTKEVEQFTLCKRCRSVWKEWGEYAYRVRHIRRHLPEWLVEKRLKERSGEECEEKAGSLANRGARR
jgi:Zn-finger nucleic acid-binding protein